MDGVFKKLGNSKIGKAAKQLKGVGTAINVVDKTAFTTDYITRAKDIVKQGNFKEEAASFRMDGIVYIANMVFPFSGELIESINNSMKGIDQEIDKIRNSLLDRYVGHTDDFALLYKKERFNLRIKEYEANINQASDFNDLQEIYSLTLKEEIKAYERLIKDIDDSIKDARNLKSFPGRKSQIESLESLKWSVENRLSRIKSGGNIEKQLRDIFYVTAGSITAVEVDQQQEQTHNSINAQADQLAASKERILSLANMDIENLTGKGSTLDYKTLDDSKLGLDLISDNEQENIDVQNFRFSTGPVNQRQKEEQNTQSFNDDQRIKTAELAVKQRQEEQQRIKQTIIKKLPTTPEPGAPADPNPDPNLEWVGWGNLVASTGTNNEGANVSVVSKYTPPNDNALPKGGSSIQINLNDGPSHIVGNGNAIMPQSVTAKPNYGDYDYVAWGTWDKGSSTNHEYYVYNWIYNNVMKGHWVYGQALKPEDMPKSGSASYAGQVMGGYVNSRNGIVEAKSITGDINMTVNFQDKSLSGAMNLDRNGSDWATATFNTTGYFAYPDKRREDPFYDVPVYSFEASLNVSGGGWGTMEGWFFGKDTAEVGGSFSVWKSYNCDRGCAGGVYRAKKQ